MNTSASIEPRLPGEVSIGAGDVVLEGELIIPAGAAGLVLFAHGSGSSRHSPRNQAVAEVIRSHGLGTLLFDLMTQHEAAADQMTGQLRFDIDFLSRRLTAATLWAATVPESRNFSFGYFGSSTGAAAALIAATRCKDKVQAVVSRGGRPDLAGDALDFVEAATLLIVGGRDELVEDLNRTALRRLQCDSKLVIIPGATHLFEEPGALAQVAELAARWFRDHFHKP
jgi:putative phosphoribosyl transferase